jgi:hydroxymethylglutaryl-CoA reductase
MAIEESSVVAAASKSAKFGPHEVDFSNIAEYTEKLVRYTLFYKETFETRFFVKQSKFFY